MTKARPIAIVTGGARRVGRAICRRFHDAGFDVLFTYRSSKDDAEALASELSAAGSAARAIACDLGDLNDVERLGAQLAQWCEYVDALVHCASTYESSPLGSLNAERALHQYTVNALSPLLLTRRLAPALARSSLPSGGSVVCMCDIHAMGRPRRDFSAYSMSKAALIEMVRSLARDLAPDIRVNGVAPGVVAFPESGFESDPEMQAAYISRVPLRRSGTPQEAAETVHWLATSAGYITGEIVRLDGGRWLA